MFAKKKWNNRNRDLFKSNIFFFTTQFYDSVFIFDETILDDSNGKERNNLSANGTKEQMDEDESSWGVLPFCPSKLAFSKVRQSYH